MPTESEASTPRERVDLSVEASEQVARALSRQARAVPELVDLFTDEHDRPADNTGRGDGSPT